MTEGKRVLLTGGTGFVGSRAADGLVAAGHTATIVTRSPERQRAERAGVDYAGWLPDVSRYDAVLHLAGEPIFGSRWTPAVKQRIRSSRIDGTRSLVAALGAADERPATLISASAVGYYGSRGDETLTEPAGPGSDFLAEVCRDWEREALQAEQLGLRVVVVRIGVVLGANGGALEQMLLPFKLGLGGPIGSGAQWFSWIHLRDLADLLVRAVDDESMRGVFNGCAPNPVSNKEFARALGRVLHRPTIFPIPAFALRLRFGQAADVLLASQRCLPEAALQAGFSFHFATLEGALRDLLD